MMDAEEDFNEGMTQGGGVLDGEAIMEVETQRGPGGSLAGGIGGGTHKSTALALSKTHQSASHQTMIAGNDPQNSRSRTKASGHTAMTRANSEDSEEQKTDEPSRSRP